MVFNKKFDEKDKKEEQTTVHSIGVEGAPASIEAQPSRGPETGLESVTKQAESVGERQKEQQVEHKAPKPHIPKQPTPKKTPKKPTVAAPRVYGYKIPVQMITNMSQVRKYKENGNPKDSLTCLSFFVDRLVKMHSS